MKNLLNLNKQKEQKIIEYLSFNSEGAYLQNIASQIEENYNTVNIYTAKNGIKESYLPSS